jgi:Thioesterase-like superfamily
VTDPNAQQPYLLRDDESRFVPTEMARGGWGPSVSGHVVGGFLGWALERAVDDPEFQPARLTVDLPRPTVLEPIEVRTVVLQDRRRLRLVEAALIQRGNEVARASVLFVRRGPQPDGHAWTPPVQMPPLPTDEDRPPTFFIRTYGWGAEVQNPDADWTETSGHKYTWVEETRPLVGGEPLTAFTRAAMAADITAAIANWGDRGLEFINVDYTLTLARLPEGPQLGLASLTHHSHDGVASGSATLVDHQGPIGTAVSVAVAQTGFAPGAAR